MRFRFVLAAFFLGGGVHVVAGDSLFSGDRLWHHGTLRGAPSPSSPPDHSDGAHTDASVPLRIVERHNKELLALEYDLPPVQQSLAAWTRLTSCWSPRSENVTEAASSTVAIVGFSFGQGANLSPGGTNRALAWQVAQLKHTNPGLKMVLQWEIADALQQEFKMTADLRISPLPDSYLSTYGVAEQAAEYLAAHPGTVSLVAHPDHALRCALNLLQPPIGVASVWPRMEGLPAAQYGVDDRYYDPLSAQAWCRNRSVYVPHELTSRASGVLAGEISFESEDSCDAR